MRLEFTDQEQAFREEVRAFLQEKLPAQIRDKVLNGYDLSREDHVLWQRSLHERGWGGIGWPKQFQHRIADMVIHLEQARSMSYLVALRCASANLPERRRALSAAKALIGQSARFVGQQAVQLHGGMGMTDELIVSHWFKRLTAAELMFGDSDTHLQRYAALTRE
ncbi:MAG: acyl-CoA dehydrogenase family protein [Steroidobacteraceae bacterium]